MPEHGVVRWVIVLAVIVVATPAFVATTFASSSSAAVLAFFLVWLVIICFPLAVTHHFINVEKVLLSLQFVLGPRNESLGKIFGPLRIPVKLLGEPGQNAITSLAKEASRGFEFVDDIDDLYPCLGSELVRFQQGMQLVQMLPHIRARFLAPQQLASFRRFRRGRLHLLKVVQKHPPNGQHLKKFFRFG